MDIKNKNEKPYRYPSTTCTSTPNLAHQQTLSEPFEKLWRLKDFKFVFRITTETKDITYTNEIAAFA